MSVQPKYLTVAEARKITNATELWVVNRSDEVLADKKRGVVNLEIKAGEDEPVHIVVPNTWVPINLAAYTERANIVKSTKFLHAVREGYLGIITDEEADVLMQSPDAQAEMTKYSALGRQRMMADANGKRAVGEDTTNVEVWVIEAVNRQDLSDADRKGVFLNGVRSLKREDCEYALAKLAAGETADLVRRRLGELQMHATR